MVSITKWVALRCGMGLVNTRHSPANSAARPGSCLALTPGITPDAHVQQSPLPMADEMRHTVEATQRPDYPRRVTPTLDWR
jgi:hypothetical protein